MHHKKTQSHSSHTGSNRPPSRRNGLLLLVLLVAQLMVILDITAVNIALPSLAKDLQLSGSQISWTITSYSLVFGSLLLFGGRAADLLGRRRLFLTGLGVFTVSSLASALAGTAGALFAARAGQGLGAAMLSPAALSIITTCFHGHAKAKALAAWGAVGGAGAAIGVLAGGLLTEFADWRMIFFVNLPVAFALAVAALKIVPADAEKPRLRGLDLRGAILATASLGVDRLRHHAGRKRRLDFHPDARIRTRRRVGSRRVRNPRDAHRAAAPRGRAARRSCGRRRARPDAGGRRLDLRPLLPLLGLPPERPRHEPADDRPGVHPARPHRRNRRSRRRARRRPPRSAHAARLGLRDRRRRNGAPRPRRRERHLSPQRPARDAGRRLRARDRRCLCLDRDPDRRHARTSPG